MSRPPRAAGGAPGRRANAPRGDAPGAAFAFSLAALGDARGVHLVEANAGTGKTYTIESIFLHLLLARGFPVDRILVVTFTEAATAELRARLRARLAAALADLQSGGAGPAAEFLAAAGVGREKAERVLRLALLSFDGAAVHTIHSFCRRVLDTLAFECGGRLATELTTDSRPLLERAVRDFFRTRVAAATGGEAALFAAEGFTPDAVLEMFRTTLLRPGLEFLPAPGDRREGAHPLGEIRAELHRFVRTRMAEEKCRLGVRTFDDLLTDLKEALAGPAGRRLGTTLRERYRAALIDEFQDTDPTQYAIFRAAFADGETPLFLIGDPKQAIYGFRGADIFAYLEAQSLATRRFTLDVNRRSAPGLVEAVNRLFGGVGRPFLLPEIGHPPSRPATEGGPPPLAAPGVDPAPFQLWYLPNAHPKKGVSKSALLSRAAEAVAAECARLAALGRRGEATLAGLKGEEPRPLTVRDLVVIVRKNKEAASVREALRARGLNAVTYGSGTVYETPEAEELHRLLTALASGRPAAVRAALATSLLGATAGDLARLDATPGAMEARLVSFRRHGELWRRGGFARALHSFLREAGCLERVAGLPDGERRATNLLHLLELLHGLEREGGLSPEALVAAFGDLAAGRTSPAESDAALLRLESDADAVRVLTVHRSKGLEFPVVFCPFVCDGSQFDRKDKPLVFHRRGEPRPFADLGSADRFGPHLGRAMVEDLAENLRLFYVAVTRASHRCHVVFGRVNDAGASAPGHLLAELPGLDDETPDFSAANKAFLALDDATLAGRIAGRLAAPGVAAVAPMPGGDPALPAPPDREEPPLAELPFERRLPDDHRIVSFSSLLAGRDHSTWNDPGDDREREGVDEGFPAAAEPAPHTPGGPAAARRFGRCLHWLLERTDFRGADRSLVANGAAAFGVDPARTEELAAFLERLAATEFPAPGGPFRLGDLPATAFAREFEFHLPVRRTSPTRLAAAFRGRGASASFCDSVAALGDHPVTGHLKGFVDLVVEAGGRFHVIDWKSDRLPAYDPGTLAAAMERHLYGLQYRLYAAALHAHLARRLPGYRHDLHFGGVFYVFARGLDPARPGDGLYFDRPGEALLEATLDALAGTDGREHA